ncbi:PTS transporter subunit EIIB [Bacillus mycoides]|uniref:PTS transporter subunit EIIB n=1 Tax=Bacillus mycoides TaxID=1405 RepID=UPI003BF57871
MIELVGGKENVVNAWHCVTRLRFNLANKEKVKLEEIKKIKGVMGHSSQVTSSKLSSEYCC